MNIHVFNPEHDIALASNLANFTAPHAGRQLRADLGFLPAGSHTLDITVYPSRVNSFGTFHLNDYALTWFGPQAWRTTGMRWTRTYRLTPSGLLSEPHVFAY